MERREKWEYDYIRGRYLVRDERGCLAEVRDEATAITITTDHNQHTDLVEQRDRLVVVLKEAMKIVSDKAAGGRMINTPEEASAVWDRCAKVIYDIEQASNAVATVEQGQERQAGGGSGDLRSD